MTKIIHVCTASTIRMAMANKRQQGDDKESIFPIANRVGKDSTHLQAKTEKVKVNKFQ